MSRSWRSSIREVVLIFVGITLALFFENWNEERLQRSQERELVAQVLDDLRETHQELLRSDLPNQEWAKDAHRRIMESVYGGSIIEPDSIDVDFGRLLSNGSRLYPQAAGYESLKAVGVDIIADDSVRLAVTGFYERYLGRVAVAETRLLDSQERSLELYMVEHFQNRRPWRVGSDVGRNEARSFYPRDLDALRRDPSFRLLMDRNEQDRARLLNAYRVTEGTLESLIELLSQRYDLGGAL